MRLICEYRVHYDRVRKQRQILKIGQLLEFKKGKTNMKGKVYEIGDNCANVKVNGKKYFVSFLSNKWSFMSEI